MNSCFLCRAEIPSGRFNQLFCYACKETVCKITTCSRRIRILGRRRRICTSCRPHRKKTA